MARSDAYDAVAIAFHWLLALAITASFSVGLCMNELPLTPLRLKLFNWHKWAGITILVFSAVRLLWRLAHRPPPLAASMLAAMPGWQRLAHEGTHIAMYLLFFAVPLTGWAYSSAAGFPVVWFGVVPLPDWVPLDKALADTVLKPTHQALAFALGALVVVHVAVTLKHQFVDRDGLFWRIWPIGARR